MFIFPDARELYELLLQRDLIDAAGNPMIDPNQHRLVRKNQRSPSLRLRFGRRSDPALYQVINTFFLRVTEPAALTGFGRVGLN